MVGKIVRFDDVRGYGFVAPRNGGEDVFLHVNDLEMDRELARPGANVSFEIEEGARGKFATFVRLSNDAPPAAATHDHNDRADPSNDDYYDVLSTHEYLHLVTEMLLRLSPPLAGDQIIQVRTGVEKLAKAHGWLEG
jgi:cold shock protein